MTTKEIQRNQLGKRNYQSDEDILRLNQCDEDIPGLNGDQMYEVVIQIGIKTGKLKKKAKKRNKARPPNLPYKIPALRSSSNGILKKQNEFMNEEDLRRKTRSMLNKITEKSKNEIIHDFLHLCVPLDSDMVLVISEIIVEKGTSDSMYSHLYAEMSRAYCDYSQIFTLQLLKVTFNLLTTNFPKEQRKQQQTVKKERFSAYLKFIANIYLQRIFNAVFITRCLFQMIKDGTKQIAKGKVDEYLLFNVIKLLEMVGWKLEKDNMRDNVDSIFSMIYEVSHLCSKEMKCLIQNLRHLRIRSWNKLENKIFRIPPYSISAFRPSRLGKPARIPEIKRKITELRNKIRRILNLVTPTTKDVFVKEFQELDIPKDTETLIQISDFIHKRAIAERMYCKFYLQLVHARIAADIKNANITMYSVFTSQAIFNLIDEHAGKIINEIEEKQEENWLQHRREAIAEAVRRDVGKMIYVTYLFRFDMIDTLVVYYNLKSSLSTLLTKPAHLLKACDIHEASVIDGIKLLQIMGPFDVEQLWAECKNEVDWFQILDAVQCVVSERCRSAIQELFETYRRLKGVLIIDGETLTKTAHFSGNVPLLKTYVPNTLLRTSENAWRPSRLRTEEERKKEEIVHKVRAILNKITPTTKRELIAEFLQLEISGNEEKIAKLMASRAVIEPEYCGTYCKLAKAVVEMNSKRGAGTEFHVFLLEFSNEFRCCEGFDEIWEMGGEKEKLDGLRRLPPLLKSDYRNFSFVGHLYVNKLINSRLVYCCIEHLLSSILSPKTNESSETNDAENCISECVKLISIVGKSLEKEWEYNGRFDELVEIIHNAQNTYSRRLKFQILDLMALRKNKWKPRVFAPCGPMTISEFRELELKQEMEIERRSQQFFQVLKGLEVRMPKLDEKVEMSLEVKRNLRKFQSILNKIDPANKNELMIELGFLQNSFSEDISEELSRILYEKMISEPDFCKIYVEMLEKLVWMETKPTGKSIILKRVLEKMHDRFFTSSMIVPVKMLEVVRNEKDEGKLREAKKQMHDILKPEFRKDYGNVVLIGHLYLNDFVSAQFINGCIYELLKSICEKAAPRLKLSDPDIVKIANGLKLVGIVGRKMVKELEQRTVLDRLLVQLEWAKRVCGADIRCTIEKLIHLRLHVWYREEMWENNWKAYRNDNYRASSFVV